QGTHMVAGVEEVEPQRIGCARGPQAQRVHVPAAPAHDRRIISNGFDRLARMPDVACSTAPRRPLLHPAAEMDVVDYLRPGELPGIAEGEPFLRILLLMAVAYR